MALTGARRYAPGAPSPFLTFSPPAASFATAAATRYLTWFETRPAALDAPARRARALRARSGRPDRLMKKGIDG
jgi:hypothetical protein